MYRVGGRVGSSASTLDVLIPERIVDIINHRRCRNEGSANHICLGLKSFRSFPI